jgi:uncharacterized membrane protein (DUF485 family)
MAEASALMTVVVGVGLAILTANHVTGSQRDAERSGRHAALFTMALQLITWMLAGAALFIPAWYIEKGRSLVKVDARAENWLIAALAGLLVIVVIRNAWSGFVGSSSDSPWNPGLLDRANAAINFIWAVAVVALLGMGFDFALIEIGISSTKIGSPILLITVSFALLFGVAAFVVRYVLGAVPLSRAVVMSRRGQQRLLRELGNSPGSWVSIRLKPAGELEPDLAFAATVWSTENGFYFRTEDAHALGRYHAWVANHLLTPDAAVHTQRVSVFAGDRPDSRRGMRVTNTTRRLWWIDAWKSHRDQSPPVSDAGSAERKADLLHIGREELSAAGLHLMVEELAATPLAVQLASDPAETRDPETALALVQASPAPARAHGTHETTIPDRAAP